MHLCPHCVLVALGALAAFFAALRMWLWRRKFEWKVSHRDQEQGCGCVHQQPQESRTRAIHEGSDHETASSP